MLSWAVSSNGMFFVCCCYRLHFPIILGGGGGGGGYIHPFHKAILHLNVFCLKLLYCFTVFCQCIDIKHTFKGKYFFF